VVGHSARPAALSALQCHLFSALGAPSTRPSSSEVPPSIPSAPVPAVDCQSYFHRRKYILPHYILHNGQWIADSRSYQEGYRLCGKFGFVLCRCLNSAPASARAASYCLRNRSSTYAGHTYQFLAAFCGDIKDSEVELQKLTTITPDQTPHQQDPNRRRNRQRQALPKPLRRTLRRRSCPPPRTQGPAKGRQHPCPLCRRSQMRRHPAHSNGHGRRPGFPH
jgi:hypothetical protein